MVQHIAIGPAPGKIANASARALFYSEPKLPIIDECPISFFALARRHGESDSKEHHQQCRSEHPYPLSLLYPLREQFIDRSLQF
jgi:hypothetical protein